MMEITGGIVVAVVLLNLAVIVVSLVLWRMFR